MPAPILGTAFKLAGIANPVASMAAQAMDAAIDQTMHAADPQPETRPFTPFS